MMTLVDLLAYCFEGRHAAFQAELAEWLRASRRLHTFVENNRSKIRAKLKPVSDEVGLLDIRAELLVAATLLREEQFSLAYEPFAARKERGPDYTVTYKTHTQFNVEVRRLRGDGVGSEAKLAAVLCDKVKQLPPSSVNLLWLVSEGPTTEVQIAEAAAKLRQRANAKEDAYFVRQDFKDASDYSKQQGRLSGVVLSGAGQAALWLNPMARHKAPYGVVLAVRKLLRAKG